jgi:hypothetical protein
LQKQAVRRMLEQADAESAARSSRNQWGRIPRLPTFNQKDWTADNEFSRLSRQDNGPLNSFGQWTVKPGRGGSHLDNRQPS